MISFRHRSNVKRIKIKTHKKLDQRMSFWLQKVFNIKNPIIGFKSIDNKYYDVDSFYMFIDKFYNSQVEIVEGSEQAEISFTSDNLNSSSFIRPSQPNLSQINHKPPSEEDAPSFVQDLKSFERKLTEGKDVSILFDINPGYKKTIYDGVCDLSNPYSPVKTSFSILLNNLHPKKSNFCIYIGKSCVVVIPLTTQYKSIILNVISRAKNLVGSSDNNRNLKPQVEDDAPSFTTYHLQERLNQQACYDYLNRMNRERLFSHYQYQKLIQKLDDNFADFYRIFCEGVLDNDYESFKNEIRHKVENNLEMLLSNVDEMDLSRPISREEQRRQHFKKPTPEIQIVKVQNYFEVLDLIKDRLEPKYLGQIKQNLLDQNQELQVYFSKFVAREYGKEQLSKRLTDFAREKTQDLRPMSRCVPRYAARARSTDAVRRETQEQQVRLDFQEEEAPMFGSLNIKPVESVVSPIKNMSDIESIYKSAWQKLSKKSQFFAPEEYGLLYHYLQSKDDMILNEIHSLQSYEDSALESLKDFLTEKISLILLQNFTEAELCYLDSIRNSSNVSYIFENFKYECDIHSFLSSLREELNKDKFQGQRVLHKKSSDSQLLEKPTKQKDMRKYSDENQENAAEPSPKASQMSLYQKNSQFSLGHLKTLSSPWMQEFDELLQFCSFNEPHKQEYLRSAYSEYNPSLFLWVRQYLRNKESKCHPASYFKQNVQKTEYENRGVMKILPLFSELLKEMERQGKITDKMRKWAVVSFMDCSLNLIGAFQVYLLQKDENEFIDTIRLAFEQDDKQMALYRQFVSRLETVLKEMCIHSEASLQIFKEYPNKLKAFIQLYFLDGNFEDLMENMDLLQTQHIEQSKMNIATLNFSGINTNPFEYDDGSEMFIKLNQSVQELVKKEMPDFKEWSIGKIDKDFTSSSRLSIGFNSSIESLDNKLLDAEEFTTLWRNRFTKWLSDPKNTGTKATEDEISMSIIMDHIFYKALIKYVYDISFQDLGEKLKTYPAKTLNQFLAKQHNRPASRLDLKEDFVIQYILKAKVDVLCLQEAGCIDWKEELIPGYSYVKNHDSVILYRKQKLGNIKADLMQTYGKDLDFNKDSAFLFTDKNYLVLSVHLKSKKINLEQAKQMFTVLKKIKEEHPLLKIIIGMDANHFLEYENLLNQEGKQIFFISPNIPDKPTTIKQRTFMQAQYKKSGVAVSEVKDHVATTHTIVESHIQKVTGEQSTDELLPNDSHPYDHYLVRSVIKFL